MNEKNKTDNVSQYDGQPPSGLHGHIEECSNMTLAVGREMCWCLLTILSTVWESNHIPLEYGRGGGHGLFPRVVYM